MVVRKNEIVAEIKHLIKIIEKWSDIDVALISDDFSGIRFYDIEKLLSIVKKYNNFIEFHPFRDKDFNAGNDLFVKEILENSLKIL